MSRQTIITALVAGLKGIASNPTVTDYILDPDTELKRAPYIGVVVGHEEPLAKKSHRYKVDLILDMVVKRNYTGIEKMVADIREYLNTAVIDDVLELVYVDNDYVFKDSSKYSRTQINASLIYKDADSDDTLANTHPSVDPVGYMAIAKRKIYELTASGSITYQTLGTYVYDSHKNANIEIPAGSGSISVDIVESNVNVLGESSIMLRDDNIVNMSIRCHFANDVDNTPIANFVYQVVNQLRTNVNLGDYYRLLRNEPFNPVYNQTFSESGTEGAEIIFNVNRYWDYTQV